MKTGRGYILFLTALLFFQVSGKTPITKNLRFPQHIGDWHLKSGPDVYRGDDLFLYINGGADIYHEYGFKEVSSVEYEKTGTGRIGIEIYRMDNPSSAFGIFSFRTGGKWDISPEGNLYFSEDYYLNILHRDNLITITSIDINSGTKEGITMFRDIFGGRADEGIMFPEPLLELDPYKYEKRIYFRGDLGLMNIYNLSASGTGIRDGAAGINKNRITILLRFGAGDVLAERYRIFLDNLKKTDRYSDFSAENEKVKFSDPEKNILTINIYKIFVLINIDLNPPARRLP